jgi:heme exporter protein A
VNTEATLLEARALEITRGTRLLLADLSFSLGTGQLGIVTGPNGAGKSSLLRVLAGLSPPSAGQVLWRHLSVGGLSPDQRQEIAYQGHLDGLKRALTVRENLEFCRRLWRGRAALNPVLEELQLSALGEQPVRALSAGQRRRVALAMLRMREARIWILDEPATNLDEPGRALVSRWIAAHLGRGGLAVIATHQPGDLLAPGTLLIEL